MLLRTAAETDLPAILAIVNDVIATSTAIYRDDPETIDERRAAFAGRVSVGLPYLVAVMSGEVVGFGTFGPFRTWPGYRFSVEHTVHVRADRRGRGVGRALVSALIAEADARDLHVMIAGIDAENQASIRLHEQLGFGRVAHFREVGFKFGRWLDLVFLQRRLGTVTAPLVAPAGSA